MKYRDITKNYVFREFECGLSIDETSNLCFKSIRTVKSWDQGNEIPDVCKRLMRKHKHLELSHCREWEGFRMTKGRLELPTGQLVSPQQILTGIGLLDINSELEIKTSTRLLQLARAITNIR
ncbi:regulator [Vibrio xuii]|nr:regulator [Vibrio xuii]